MKNKIVKKALAISLLTALLCGCSNQKEVDSSNINSIVSFTKDSSTIKNDDVWIVKNTQQSISNNDEDVDVIDPLTIVGELKIENTDNTVSYYIDGGSIIYNNITFLNLKDCIDKLELPCDKNTFINFIIKTFTTESGTVSTYYYNDKEVDIDIESLGEASTSIPLDDSLSDSEEYLRVKGEHNNVPVNWCLTLIDTVNNIEGTIYGCDKYLMYSGSSKLHTVDMSEYNYTETINVQQQHQETEQNQEEFKENESDESSDKSTE